MAEFFQTNRVIVYFVYGEAFFILGLAIALQSRKHSRLALAKRLWLLAGFGLVHAVYEWGAVFIPIQATYLPDSAVSVLQFLQLVLGAVSFLALLQFGVELVILGVGGYTWLTFVPPALFVLWAMLTLWVQTVMHISLAETLVAGEILARYGLAVPGALAAAVGLWWQARQVLAMELPRIATYFRAAAWAFAGYAVLSAFTPAAGFVPAAYMNYDAVLSAIGVPVPVFRAILGAAIAYLIIRGSEIFDIETDRMLEEVAQARAVATDRERIGRELHDSIIQSLYASGLILEDASLTIDEDAARAKDRIRDVIDALNRTIRDIRRYILDLRGETDTGDLETSLEELVRGFRLETLIQAEFCSEGPRRPGPARPLAGQMLSITREALTNVSKHARATRVDVTLVYRPGELEIDVVDNGRGFLPAARAPDGDGPANGDTGAGEHQGLRNMQERAELIGGQVTIESKPGKGTRVSLVVPATSPPGSLS